MKPARPRKDLLRKYNLIKRKQPGVGSRVRRPKKFVKVLSEATIGKILLHGCKCGMDCFGSMTKVETEAKKELIACRRRNTTMTEQELTEWIVELIRQLHPRSDCPLQYRVGSQSVCKEAFLKIYGITFGKLKRCRRLALNGKTRVVHGAVGGCLRPKSKKIWVETWLQRWLKSNSDQLVNGYYVVPAFIQEKDVHKQVAADWCKEHNSSLYNGNNSSTTAANTCHITATAAGLKSAISSSSSSSTCTTTTSISPAIILSNTNTTPPYVATTTKTTIAATTTASVTTVTTSTPNSMLPPSIDLLRRLWKKLKILFPKKGNYSETLSST